MPFLSYKMKLDPAIATEIFVTTSIDILEVLIYFLTASLIL